MLILFTLAAAGAAATVGPAEARALGELVTVSVARHKAFDVVSSADMRRVIELEADKATLGCSEAGSCLAELAGAMGARYVVFGQVAPVGSQIALTLNLFDSQTGSSSGRVVLLGGNVDEIIPHIDVKVDTLVAGADPGAIAAVKGDDGAVPPPAPASPSASEPASPRVRVLVLDLEVPAPATAVESGGPPLWMLAGGGGAALVGGGVAAAGAFYGATAETAQRAALAAKFQDDRAAALARRDEDALTANLLYGAGAVVAVAGLGLAAASFLVEAP